MIWNLYLPPPRGAAVIAAPAQTAFRSPLPRSPVPAPRRGHGYPQARGKNKGRARPAEGLRPSEFLRCPSGKSKPQTQDLQLDLLASILPKT